LNDDDLLILGKSDCVPSRARSGRHRAGQLKSKLRSFDSIIRINIPIPNVKTLVGGPHVGLEEEWFISSRSVVIFNLIVRLDKQFKFLIEWISEDETTLGLLGDANLGEIFQR
jgi:hypothetical protein